MSVDKEFAMQSRAMSLFVFIACASLPAAAYGGHLVRHEMSIPEIIAALEENDMSAHELRATESYTRLDVVDLTAIEPTQALEDTLSEIDDDWARVQTAIVSNDLIRQELVRRSIPIRRIVAATMNVGGVLTIYIR
jgi:hypothetical protein